MVVILKIIVFAVLLHIKITTARREIIVPARYT